MPNTGVFTLRTRLEDAGVIVEVIDTGRGRVSPQELALIPGKTAAK
jgi:hypothetical protein